MATHSTNCFHCGELLSPTSNYTAEVQGKLEHLCCPGCQAVTQAIVAGGLESYYKVRTELPPRPELTASELAELAVYDAPELLQDFVYFSDVPASKTAGTEATKNQQAEVTLAVEGITCAACAWLIENQINQLEGVEYTGVNLSAHRASIKWDISKLPFSKLLAEFKALGYNAQPWRADEQQQKLEKEQKTAIRRLIVAAIGSMQAMIFGISLEAGILNNFMEAEFILLFQWLSFLVTTPVIVYSALPFFTSALSELKQKRLNMDFPVSLAIGLGYLASVWALVTQTGQLHFYAVAMFTFFLLFGRYIEMRTRHKIGAAGNALESLLPQAALVLNEQGEEEFIPSRNLKAGDRLVVKAGHTFAADGKILEGHSSVNQATMTGEYLPQAFGPGDKVLAGTQNIASPLIVEVEKTGKDVRLASISRLSERALAEKPAIATLANKIASYFVAALLVVASLTFVAWLNIDSSRAFWVVISLLIVTCPCALALATPTALAVANSSLARQGVLITRGNVLEGLAKIDHIIFDKTGTLTEGRLELKETLWLGADDDPRKADILAYAAAIETLSEHPIARAFASSHTPAVKAENIQAVTGQGIQGEIEGKLYRLGRADFVVPDVQVNRPTEEGQWLLMADEQEPLAWFRLADQLRPDCALMLEQLQAQNLSYELLSGDQEGPVAALAQELGIETYTANATPETKLARLKELQAQGKQVVMVGDGVNDVPVLSAAKVSIAMGDATDLAKTSADVLLLSSRLALIPLAIKKAQLTKRTIKQNLGLSFAYNIIAIPAAAMGLVAPWVAALGMTSSSLAVVINALRLKDKASEQQLNKQQAIMKAQQTLPQ